MVFLSKRQRLLETCCWSAETYTTGYGIFTRERTNKLLMQMYFQARSEALFTVILASPATSVRVFLFADWLWLAKSLLMTWMLQNKWLRAILEGHPLLKTTPSGGTWNSVHILKLTSSMKESYGSNVISEQANLTADFPLLSVFGTRVLTTRWQHFQMDIDVMETIFFFLLHLGTIEYLW